MSRTAVRSRVTDQIDFMAGRTRNNKLLFFDELWMTIDTDEWRRYLIRYWAAPLTNFIVFLVPQYSRWWVLGHGVWDVCHSITVVDACVNASIVNIQNKMTRTSGLLGFLEPENRELLYKLYHSATVQHCCNDDHKISGKTGILTPVDLILLKILLQKLDISITGYGLRCNRGVRPGVFAP